MKASGNEGPDISGYAGRVSHYPRIPHTPVGHTHSAKEVAESLEVHATAGLAAEHTHFMLSSVKIADGL